MSAADGARDEGRDEERSDEPAPAPPSPVATSRWAVAAGIALLALGLGAVTQNRAVLVATVVPLAFVAYGYLATVPTPELSARRSFDPARPAVGERVTVTVTVRNQGTALRDCRLADVVPDALAVVEGTATAATTLRSGEETTVSYTVRARRGTHEFGPVRAAAVGGGGGASTVALSAESRLRCRASGTDETAGAPNVSSGDTAADTGSGGTEFHAVREYRRADPLSRVDWRRFARTGELSTIEFRDDRAATVAVVVDATVPTFRRAAPAAPAAVEYALFAAEGAFETLLERDARVALGFYPDAPAAVGPGTGVDHRMRGRAAFDAYGPGATRDPAEVPVALGAAGDPARRARHSAPGPTAGSTRHGRPDGPDSGTGTRDRAARPDGGDPFSDPFAPADDTDGSPGPDDWTGKSATSDGRTAEATTPDDESGTYDPDPDRDITFGDGEDEPEVTDPATALRAALPAGARVLFCSPLLDDGAVDLVRTLRADEHDVRVLSPALEAPTPAVRLATLERADRVATLRGTGIGVVDWTDEPLREALARALRGW